MNPTTQQSARSKINELAIGETINFPIDRYDYIVSCCYRLRVTTQKDFTSKVNGEVVEITRNPDK